MKSADLTALTFIADKKRHISPKVTQAEGIDNS